MHVPSACGRCRDFETDPVVLEAGLAGLAVLSSALAATRAGDGYCGRHDRFLRATACCGAFTAVE